MMSPSASVLRRSLSRFSSAFRLFRGPPGRFPAAIVAFRCYPNGEPSCLVEPKKADEYHGGQWMSGHDVKTIFSSR